MSKKIHWKTVFVLLLFSVSVLSLSVVVFSPICLTYTGSLILLIMVILVSYSGRYLFDRYKSLYRARSRT